MVAIVVQKLVNLYVIGNSESIELSDLAFFKISILEVVFVENVCKT